MPLLVKPLYLRVAVDVACILSIFGSSIIIITYFCFKAHQTRARYILVHLSISNLGHVLANFIGEVKNLDGAFASNKTFSYDISNLNSEEKFCITQAFATIYFNGCGMLWTICLAVYLYILILSMRQTYFTKYFVWMSYFICYSLPLLVTTWLLLTNRLGYAPYSTPGYCGLVNRRPCDPDRDVFGEFFGYDLWVSLTILLTMLLYLSALCYLKLLVS